MVHWLRMQVLGMEVPGSNSGNVFFDISVARGDCSIRVSRDFTFVWFLLYKDSLFPVTTCINFLVPIPNFNYL